MEDRGYKYILKLSQFFTILNFRNNCSIPENVKISGIFVQQATTRIYKTQVLDWRQFASPILTYHSGRVISHSLHRKISTCNSFFQKTSYLHKKGSTGRDYPWWISPKRVDQTIELFGIYLVSNASALFSPDNTHSSLTNFLPEQLNLEYHWEVAISERSYPSLYQNVIEKFMFFENTLSKSSKFYFLQAGLDPFITDVAEHTLIQE